MLMSNSGNQWIYSSGTYKTSKVFVGSNVWKNVKLPLLIVESFDKIIKNVIYDFESCVCYVYPNECVYEIVNLLE